MARKKSMIFLTFSKNKGNRELLTEFSGRTGRLIE